MAHIFVSYSKKDIDFARQLKTLLEKSDFVVWMDDTELELSERWWPQIEDSIETCAAFIVLMSPNSKPSDWVEREILHAERNQKKIFPILIRDDYWSRLANIQHFDMTAGVPSSLPTRLNQGLRLYIPVDTSMTVLPPLPGQLLSTADQPPTPFIKPAPTFRSQFPLIAGGVVTLAVIALVLVVIFNNGGGLPPATMEPTTATMTTREIALVATEMSTATDSQTIPVETPTPRPTATTVPPTPTDTNTAPLTQTSLPTETDTPPTLTASATISLELLALTFEAEQILSDATAFAGQTATDNAAQTATATQWTATPIPPTPNQTLIFDAFLTQRAASTSTAARTQTMAAWTDTPTHTPTLTPLEFASTPVASNAAWRPVSQDFNGVSMVLVPAGCFLMNDEQNNEQCFPEPFWVDQTEVIQADFERLDGVKATANVFAGDERPVEQIRWVEARDFCALRGGRLPTEAEWEYAARGPEGWVYPWGNEFVAENVIYTENSNRQTSPVGADIRTAGASWVGALDMSGNVWEWVSTIYSGYTYPYIASDGREDINRTDVLRVVRGGSWGRTAAILRSSVRSLNDFGSYFIGFRCARSR